MKQSKLSAGKRLTKPILFGTLLVGLATAFFNRHVFMEDLAELREQERARNDIKRQEVLERRQRQIDELAKKSGGGSWDLSTNIWLDNCKNLVLKKKTLNIFVMSIAIAFYLSNDLTGFFYTASKSWSVKLQEFKNLHWSGCFWDLLACRCIKALLHLVQYNTFSLIVQYRISLEV